MRVAFLQPYKMLDHYFFDFFNVAAAADLRRAGHHAEVLTYRLDPAADERVELEAVARHLAARHLDLVFLDHVWSPAVPAAVAAAVPRVACLHAPAALDWPSVGFVVPLPRRAAVRALVEALEGRGDLAGVPDLHWRGPRGPERPAGYAPLSSREELADVDLDYASCVDLTPGRVPPETRKHVVGDWGCAYRHAPNRTGFLDGLELPPGVAPTGCTFCDRAASDPLSSGEAVEVEMRQLAQLRGHFRSIDKVIVIDELALRYVDRFAAEAARRGLAGTYLFSGRADHVVRWRDRIARAAAASPDVRIVLYCIGIENFSDPELARMNKGLTAAGLLEALSVVDDLTRRHPNVSVEDSYGFILFTPWTTIADLEANLDAFRRVGFQRFRASVADTRLRLYPTNALYHRAAADGLLVRGPGRAAHAEAYGYDADAPWRFADPEVAALDAALAGTRGEERLRRLEQLLRRRAAPRPSPATRT